MKKTREEIMSKAGELAVAYEKEYLGCSQCTFMAVVDALRWGGMEVVTEDVEGRLFPGLCLLTGGVGVTTDGTCGAVIASALAIGMSLGSLRGIRGKDMSIVGDGYGMVWRAILDRYDEKYRSQLCKDVQRKHFGKAWDFRIPGMTDKYLKVSDGCTIKETAVWTWGVSSTNSSR